MISRCFVAIARYACLHVACMPKTTALEGRRYPGSPLVRGMSRCLKEQTKTVQIEPVDSDGHFPPIVPFSCMQDARKIFGASHIGDDIADDFGKTGLMQMITSWMSCPSLRIVAWAVQSSPICPNTSDHHRPSQRMKKNSERGTKKESTHAGRARQQLARS